jgi:hypothetical protein
MGPDLFTIGNLVLHMWLQWWWQPLPPVLHAGARAAPPRKAT